ncbi:MAG: carbamoyltransferase HypF [Oscillospiraceae bacterium]|nr:carbamoyltransferase HypF [Oscillospiraceae bacterium]
METVCLRVYGIVQGVGFRPTVSRHAATAGIRGTVCNFGPYVEIYAQGEPEQVSRFRTLLEKQPPRRASVLKIETIPVEDPDLYENFSIIESGKTRGDIFVSPDIAICDDCISEMYDPRDRRYLHPFINCTCCGPRLTILDSLPYDRERTSMKEFPMCPDCAEEYYDPATRRYDAQPVCCPDCGPEVYLLGETERGREAITKTRETILAGGIAAIKGIGGFHLSCDATDETAVARLRDRKKRPQKPFAVMMRDMDTVMRECEVSPAQAEILTGHQKPILLLRKKPGGRLAPSVAPDNPYVGVMLPYTPLHLLLFRYDDGLHTPVCLVMTSGNVSGAPICREDGDVEREILPFCDRVLSHNRKIRIRADDSVMDFYQDRPYMIRRSRGYAPLPVMVNRNWNGSVLAVGGELKNTFCIGSGDLFYPSPYVGDLADIRTVEALEETVGRMETLLEASPAAAVCDLHPRYNSTMVAEQTGLPLIQVQHHFAHVLSCMAENDLFEKTIGLSYDGTGYGTDGTIWGGEILLSDLQGFERSASIVPFRQAGGDASSREGWRIAVSLIYDLTGDRNTALDLITRLGICEENEASATITMLEHGINTIVSTSMGRLFDGVSAILGVRKSSTFEGEAATTLQFRAENAHCSSIAWEEPLLDGDENRFYLNTPALVRYLIEGRLSGEDVCDLAFRFHEALAEMSLSACLRIRERTGVNTAAMTGGCFQNRLLLSMTEERLKTHGFHTLTHRLIPPNDGGLCLGQAVYGMNLLQQPDWRKTICV